MTVAQYLTNLNTLYKTGLAREHAYRGDLAALLHSILPGILATNEPARQACGQPDLVISRNEIQLGYIEAKDIGVDLGHKSLSEQFERYKAGLDNLIITDYLEFQFYNYKVLVAKVAIGKLENDAVVPLPENFEYFEQLIKNFAQTVTQTIKSPTRLAEMMAGKARLMAKSIEDALDLDDKEERLSGLKRQMLSFKQMLIHDITNKAFADIYAQTIAYGMFAARYHDPTLPTFSREEAATLIPKSNPFLRKLFHDIAGPDLDDRIAWIVDSLVSIFLATDVATIMRNFGRSTKQEDPVVHFYETFLASYSPALRKARGVWYTPQPVVNFIVRAVDDILKTEFGLKDGLADKSKTKIKVKAHKFDERSKNKSKITGEQEVEKEVHRVQILDPATGTGTFLAEVVRHIFRKFEGQKGIWNQYVNEHLIPRLNGFELLMASYAMAHLKMDMLLTETGYTPTDDQRFKIFLTNSLEEPSNENIDLFSILADEANAANQVKREAPVMVVIGNPPYSGESSNKSEWIMSLMDDYKKEPGGKVKLKEKNSKWINDDYVKFIRFGQHFIEKNGEGVLAFINPHGFLDNPTFRGMRWSLLNTYDKIYTIDLHGNSKKKETAPDGSADQNVFDILQGVSINLFVKTGQKKKDCPARLFHYDLFGKRDFKYHFLNNNSIDTITFNNIFPGPPQFFMSNKDFEIEDEYNRGLTLNTLFNINGNGIVSKRDSVAYQNSKEQVVQIIRYFLSDTVDQLLKRFHNVSWDSRDGKIEFVKSDINESGLNEDLISECEYRPFDKKWTYYTGKSKGFIGWPVKQVMRHIRQGKNLGLVIGRQGQVVGSMPWNLSFITNTITDFNLFYRGGGMLFPLYLYPETNGQLSTDGEQKRVPNLNPEIVKQIAEGLGLQFVSEKEGEGEVCFANSADVRPEFRNTFAPIDLLDYIYAVLHSPAYREKYKEFLKIDFPRVPYPTDTAIFWQLVQLGGELRQIHLLESDVVEKPITQFNINGDYKVDKPMYRDGSVFINETQHFENVPEVAWNFYIGGYQPAQKWLKDRKGRVLSIDDIYHYQKIIVALTETHRLMKEIDKVLVV